MNFFTYLQRAALGVRSHFGAVLLAASLALLVVIPLILFPLLAKEQYQGINIAHFGSDEHFYLVRAREVLDGNGLGNAVLRDGKDNQDPYFTWNERVLLAPFRWLGVAKSLNVVTLYNVMNFIGVFVLVILLYIFAYQLSENKLFSLAVAGGVVGGYSLVFNRTIFYQDMNVYGRAMTPYLSSIALFAYLNLLVYSQRSARRLILVASILAFGALFYIYLYAWSYALTFNLVLLGLYLFRREWAQAKKITLITLGGILMGAYNLFLLLSSLLSEQGRAVRYIHFLQHTHTPTFSLVGLVLLILFAVYWRKRRSDEHLTLFLAFILTGWIVLNQQLITGMRIQPGHYYWYFVVPLGIIVALMMVWSLLSSRQRVVFSIAVLLTVYVNTIGGQYRSTLAAMPAKLDEQHFQPILQELQKDSRPSVVLVAGDENAYLYTIYTHHDLFWYDVAMYYNPDEERLKDSLAVFLMLNREARNDVRGFLDKASDIASTSTIYSGTYASLEGFTSGLSYPEYLENSKKRDSGLLAHRQTLIGELDQEVKQLKNDPQKFKAILDRYGVAYVVWDAMRYSEWDMSIIPNLREIKSVNNLHLYHRD